MLDLAKAETEGLVTVEGDPSLSDINPEAGTLTVKLKLRAQLRSVEHAKAWEGALPGIHRAYVQGTAAEDGDIYTYGYKPSSQLEIQLQQQVLGEKKTPVRTNLLVQQDRAKPNVVSTVKDVVGQLSRKASWVDIRVSIEGVPMATLEALLLGMSGKHFLQLADPSQLDLFQRVGGIDLTPTDPPAGFDELEKRVAEGPKKTAPAKEATRYQCPKCGKVLTAKTDGTLRKHTDSKGVTCPGSGLPTSEASVVI